MIKINLLPQRKPKRRQAEPGQKDIALGILVLLVLGAGVFFGLHRPTKKKLEDMQASNKDLSGTVKRIKDQLKGPPTIEDLRANVQKANDQKATIDKLSAARAVPAHLLHELGEIMTPGHMPTMLPEISKQVLDPKNETYRIDPLWNAQHVWITKLAESKGTFTLEGGAESDGDVTQLAKRMQASVFFRDVNPRGGARITDKDTGVTYYQFSITGKVVY